MSVSIVHPERPALPLITIIMYHRKFNHQGTKNWECETFNQTKFQTTLNTVHVLWHSGVGVGFFILGGARSVDVLIRDNGEDLDVNSKT